MDKIELDSDDQDSDSLLRDKDGSLEDMSIQDRSAIVFPYRLCTSAEESALDQFCKHLQLHNIHGNTLSSLKIRLVHGEAFGFPIHVNTEMIELQLLSSKSSSSVDKEENGNDSSIINRSHKNDDDHPTTKLAELVLEVPIEEGHHVVTFATALGGLLAAHASPSLQSLILQGFEGHRWISFDLWMNCLQALLSNQIETLWLHQCTLTRDSFSQDTSSSSSSSSSYMYYFPKLKILGLKHCRLQERPLFAWLNAHNHHVNNEISSSGIPNLQELHIQACGEYMLPLIFKPTLHHHHLKRLHCDASGTLDVACATRSSQTKLVRTWTTTRLPRLCHLYLGDANVPYGLLEGLLWFDNIVDNDDSWTGCPTRRPLLSIELPKVPLLSLEFVQRLLPQLYRFRRLILDFDNSPVDWKDQLLAQLLMMQTSASALPSGSPMSFSTKEWNRWLCYYSRYYYPCRVCDHPVASSHSLLPWLLASIDRTCSATGLFAFLRTQGHIPQQPTAV